MIAKVNNIVSVIVISVNKKNNKNFSSSVCELLKKIPKGKITTYKEISIALRKPGAARAVGSACRKNPFAPKVPCHRVIKSNGIVGGYLRGTKEKIRLLSKEGIRIKNKKILSLERVLVTAKELG